MPLSPKQRAYMAQATHRWNIKCGAVRSGKTHLDVAYVIPRRILDSRGKPGIVALIGNTQDTLTRNILLPMRRLWGDVLVGAPHGDRIRLFGRDCHLFGADTRDRAKAIQGTSFAYCYGDELTTWAPEVFDMVKSRLDQPHSRFDGTCNPAGPGHWFHRFLHSGADIFRQDYTIDDNPALPEAFVAQLKAEYAGTALYGRYILGRWEKAEGLIYRGFEPERDTAEAVAEGVQVHSIGFACDVGHSNATAFLACGEGSDGRLWVLDEYYHSGRERGEIKSPAAYARDFARFQREVMGAYPDARYTAAFVDPSARGFMQQLREAGVTRVYKARNDVLAGIGRTASLLDGGGIRLLTRCGHTLRELGAYAWNAAAAAQGEDRPVKADDHCMDALRYYVMGRAPSFVFDQREAAREDGCWERMGVALTRSP